MERKKPTVLYAVGIRMEKWPTAFLSSRTLAQYSTVRDAGGLNCRVRNGTGCYSAAMAVVPKPCIVNNYIRIYINNVNNTAMNPPIIPVEQLLAYLLI